MPAHFAELHIGNAFDQLVMAEREPRSHRARAARDGDRNIDPGLPRRHVRVVDLQKKPAGPVRQELDRVAAQVSAHIDGRSELGRRHRAKAEAMAAAAVDHLQVDTFELERRSLPQLIAPRHDGVVHFDVALLQQPVGEAAAPPVVHFELDARDREHALRIAAHVEHRTMDVERVKVQAERGERTPRERALDPGQVERAPSGFVEHRDVFEREMRAYAFPVRGNLYRW